MFHIVSFALCVTAVTLALKEPTNKFSGKHFKGNLHNFAPKNTNVQSQAATISEIDDFDGGRQNDQINNYPYYYDDTLSQADDDLLGNVQDDDLENGGDNYGQNSYYPYYYYYDEPTAPTESDDFEHGGESDDNDQYDYQYEYQYDDQYYGYGDDMQGAADDPKSLTDDFSMSNDDTGSDDFTSRSTDDDANPVSGDVDDFSDGQSQTPTAAPTVVPAVATSNPTAAPSLAPPHGVKSTRAPTTLPTAVVLNTYSFLSNITLTNVVGLPLSPLSRTSVEKATAFSMGLDPWAVTYEAEHYPVSPTTSSVTASLPLLTPKRLRLALGSVSAQAQAAADAAPLSGSSVVIVTVSTTFSSPQSTDPDAIYKTLTTSLLSAIADDSFTARLQQAATGAGSGSVDGGGTKQLSAVVVTEAASTVWASSVESATGTQTRAPSAQPTLLLGGADPRTGVSASQMMVAEAVAGAVCALLLLLCVVYVACPRRGHGGDGSGRERISMDSSHGGGTEMVGRGRSKDKGDEVFYGLIGSNSED